MTGGLHLRIDGKKIPFQPGETVLQAALKAGIQIPHFCYHPGLGVEGSCRLCLVEVEGSSKLQTSCNLPCREGLAVRTDSPAAMEARKGVLEFFLLNHPLDCPICDKGGECPLQDFTVAGGQARGRMEFPRTHKTKHQVIGEHIILDKERCVLCNRCVRFLRDLTGREELGFRKRGAYTEVFVPEGTQLTAGFTGNLADFCPVGALTSREFRFRARPWEMKTVDSVCGECSLGCSARIWTKGKKVLRMTPRFDPAVNEWWLCDRGCFSVNSRLSGDRVLRPYRPDQDSAPTSPDVFLDLLESGLRRVPRGKMAFVAHASLTNEEFSCLKEVARDLGALLYVPMTKEVLAARVPAAEFPSALEEAGAVRVLGEDLEKDHPVLLLRLRRLAHLGKIRWVTEEAPATPARIESGGGTPLFLLLQGANSRGILDQWESGLRPFAELEKEITRGRVEGLFWVGPAPEDENFREYLRTMPFLVHAVERPGQAARGAAWVLPLDSFYEKSGTYTNTFGHVGRLRAATRLIDRGFEPLSILTGLASRVGRR